MVRIRGVSGGVGSSTVALALADAADAAGVRTRVLDGAPPPWSGLTGCTVTELGTTGGWQRGRRGTSILIDRVADTVLMPAELPLPLPVDQIALTVLDTGWTARELHAVHSAWVTGPGAQVEVLVTSSHRQALSHAEAAIELLRHQRDHRKRGAGDGVNGPHGDRVALVIVVTDAQRRTDSDLMAAGGQLRLAHQHGAVVCIPRLPRRHPGLGPEPLPRHLTHSAQRLLDLVTTITGPLTTATKPDKGGSA